MTVDYDYTKNVHTILGAKTALPYLFNGIQPQSLLDVGCGMGTWIRAVIDYGITDICGIDAFSLADRALLFPSTFFHQQDLTQPWNLGRKFDIVLCLEVGEHLPPDRALILIESLVAHAEHVVFSGACPGQSGQHHVNCQWPEYWQRLFNAKGYACEDDVRWRIWDFGAIEPWYRQNVFMATWAPDRAGREPRIKPVVHPDMHPFLSFDFQRRRDLSLIEAGSQSVGWYLTTPIKAYSAKLKRILSWTSRK